MNCPACGTARTEVAVSDVKIQACKGGCGGLWFDEWTLRKVDQPDQSAGEALLHIEQSAAVKLDPEKRRNCPRDAGIVMMRHFWSVKRDVVVDECPKCEGIFLDPGELAEIRSDHKSDGDRHKAAQAYYREMFDTQLPGRAQRLLPALLRPWHRDAAGATVREPHRLRGEHGQPGSPDPQRSGVVPPYVGLGGGAERRGPGRDAGRTRELRADGRGRRCELRGAGLGNTRLKRRELGEARAQEARRTAAPAWARSPTPRA